MKKILIVLLALVMVLSFAACDTEKDILNNDPQTTENNNNSDNAVAGTVDLKALYKKYEGKDLLAEANGLKDFFDAIDDEKEVTALTIKMTAGYGFSADISGVTSNNEMKATAEISIDDKAETFSINLVIPQGGTIDAVCVDEMLYATITSEGSDESEKYKMAFGDAEFKIIEEYIDNITESMTGEGDSDELPEYADQIIAELEKEFANFTPDKIASGKLSITEKNDKLTLNMNLKSDVNKVLEKVAAILDDHLPAEVMESFDGMTFAQLVEVFDLLDKTNAYVTINSYGLPVAAGASVQVSIADGMINESAKNTEIKFFADFELSEEAKAVKAPANVADYEEVVFEEIFESMFGGAANQNNPNTKL